MSKMTPKEMAGQIGGVADPRNASERPLMWATTARISPSFNRSLKYGMALAGSPFATTCRRSSSVGGCPGGVDLYLKNPCVKSRGRGIIDGAAEH